MPRTLADVVQDWLREFSMRKWFFMALALIAGSGAFAGSSAGFTGGPGDGYAHGDFITLRLTSVASHFLGGVRDGYSSSAWKSHPPATDPAQGRFAGSVHDGYDSARFVSIWQQSKPSQFSGGGSDGYTSSKWLSSWWQIKLGRFSGGSFDGYDRNAVVGLPNWILGDTDGNGLPDWWEFKYFGILTGTPPQADADRDGVSNLAEYLSGTNPTNASSYFHIVSLTPGSPTKILVTCEPGRFYTLLCADDIATNWVACPGQFRIASSVEGKLELDDTSGATNRFYRVRLEY